MEFKINGFEVRRKRGVYCPFCKTFFCFVDQGSNGFVFMIMGQCDHITQPEHFRNLSQVPASTGKLEFIFKN